MRGRDEDDYFVNYLVHLVDLEFKSKPLYIMLHYIYFSLSRVLRCPFLATVDGVGCFEGYIF